MCDEKREQLTESSESEGKNICGADCPNCVGGTCVLETGHPSLHHCGSCGNAWETLLHRSSSTGL
jgi:hypothetical protein